jgi:hypothetical protein
LGLEVVENTSIWIENRSLKEDSGVVLCYAFRFAKAIDLNFGLCSYLPRFLTLKLITQKHDHFHKTLTSQERMT